MELDPYLTPCTKINSEWIKGLTSKAKTIKLFKENIGINIHELGDDFLEMTPETQAKKEKSIN